MIGNIVVSVVVVLALSVSAPVPDQAPGRIAGDQEVTPTILDLSVAATLLEHYLYETGFYPESRGEVVPLSDVFDSMPAPYRERVPDRDPWGERYVYWSDGNWFLIVSSGRDRQLDRSYNPSGERGHDPLDWEPLTASDDVVFSEDGLLQSPYTASMEQRRTAADMRSLGTACEAYAVDNNLYPGPTDGFVRASWLTEVLQVYIKNLPTHDGWGNEIWFRSSGQGYVIVSFGADGMSDDNYWQMSSYTEIEAAGEVRDPARDIIFMDGQFVQWPTALAKD